MKELLQSFEGENFMQKKDVDQFRRNLKIDNYLLTLKDLCNMYVVKQTSEIYFQQKTSFSLLEKEEQELFVYNFRKALTGQIDQKLFPLRFKQEGESSTRTLLYESLTSSSEQWENDMTTLVKKMLAEKQYETDIVITFVRGDYVQSSRRDIEDEFTEEESYVNPFILCTINETKMPNNELLFDYIEKEFTYHVEVNPAIDLKSPINGFLFPAFQSGLANVNNILYTTRKAYALDDYFLDNVLQVDVAPTAEDDKIIFNEVVKRVAGEQLSTQKLSHMYEEVHERINDEENEEVQMLDYRDIEDLLVVSGIQGIEPSEVKEAFETIIDDATYELKAENVIPKFTTKSLKIKTKVANFSLRPQDLQYVRQVKIDGKLCLVIEIDESTEIDGFSLIPEAMLTEVNRKEE